ncbi:hypothetical protein EB73_00980 [Mycobacterium sp. SWH-M3]|nr:hypothetical protein EB73_00980 [Mycobacterium sp. SWH-M3]
MAGDLLIGAFTRAALCLRCDKDQGEAMSTVRGLVCTVIIGAATTVAVPHAQADVHFVGCAFTVATPFIYDVNGQQYVGSRVDATNCTTNLGSTPIQFEMEMSVSNQEPDGRWAAHTNHYLETRDVHDGDSFSVTFPNNDQLIPLKPGGYLASATAVSGVPGYLEPQHIAASQFSWGVPSATG